MNHKIVWMIHILLPVYTTRHKYVFRIIFDIILGVEYKFTIASTKDDVTALLNDEEAFIGYGIVNDDRILTIYDSELLNEGIVASQLMAIDNEGEFPKYFYLPENTLIDFDLFSAVFHLVTEYERLDIPVLDKHGRYREGFYETMRSHNYKLPLVDIYAEYLWKRLTEKFPVLKPRPEKKFTYEFTIDVDQPWAFLNKGIYGYLGLLKDKILGNTENIENRKIAISTNKDPFDSFDELFELLPPENTIFFFLLNGKSYFDSHFTSRNKKYRELIRKVDSRGYKIGLHPSYFSYLEPEIMESQRKSLEKIINKPVTITRQHFLKYYLPDTYEYLEEAGLKDDYTSCMISDSGFRNFICRPFPFFNMHRNTISPITIHPTMAMDTSFLNYNILEPELAVENIKFIIDSTVEYKGKFVLLWHNSNFTEFNNMGEWKTALRKIVAYIKEKADNQ